MVFRKRYIIFVLTLLTSLHRVCAQNKTNLLGYYTGNMHTFGNEQIYESFIVLAKDSALLSENYYQAGQYYAHVKKGTWSVAENKITFFFSDGTIVKGKIRIDKNPFLNLDTNDSTVVESIKAAKKLPKMFINDITYSAVKIVNPEEI